MCVILFESGLHGLPGKMPYNSRVKEFEQWLVMTISAMIMIDLIVCCRPLCHYAICTADKDGMLEATLLYVVQEILAKTGVRLIRKRQVSSMG